MPGFDSPASYKTTYNIYKRYARDEAGPLVLKIKMDDKEINLQYPRSWGETHKSKKLMGPIRLIGFIGLLGLMGCSGDDSDSRAGSEDVTSIAFFCNMQEGMSVTRAGLETKGPTLFTVYGYKNTGEEGTGSYTTYQTVFPGYTVSWAENTANTSTTNTNGWEYVGQELLGQVEQTVKFWDMSAKAYRFFGITKTFDNIDGKVTNGAFDLTFRVDLTTPSGIDAVPYYSHLWFCDNSYEPSSSHQYGRPVELVFLRPVCKVRFMFVFEDSINNNRRNTDLDDMNFHRSDDVTIKQKGKVIISYPLSGTGTTETCVFDTGASGIPGFTREYREDDPLTPSVNETDHFWYYVLPITGQGPFTLNVSVDGDLKEAVVPAAFMDWLPGNEYTYIFKVHVDGKVTIDAVQSAFTEWTVQENSYNVYNW